MRAPSNRPLLVLALVTIGHLFVSIDRGLMAVLQEPIKRDMGLSDSQLAILTGLSFGLLFAIASLPIGWLVDRFNRRNILAFSVFTFSGATAAGSASLGFVHLFAMRSIVGASEAGAGPAATSLLADLFRPSKRPGAFSIFYAGVPTGFVISFLVGGWLTSRYGWRDVLLCAGAPGMLLAIAFLFFVGEPARPASSRSAVEVPSLRTAFRLMANKRALRHVLICAAVTSGGTAGLIGFSASFLVRLHHLDIAAAGVILATFYGAVGALGSFVGGWCVTRLLGRDQRWSTWWCALAYLIAAPAVALMVLSPSLISAIGGLTIVALATNSTYGTLIAVLHSLVTARMRGAVMATYALASYLLGLSLGPLIVGGLSDWFEPHFGTASLRWAMLSVFLLYLWGALHLLLASRRLQQEVIIEPIDEKDTE